MDKVARTRKLVTLVARAREGDEAALESLLVDVHVHVHRFFSRWLYKRPGWEDTVDDLAQETLIKIARSLDTSLAENDAVLLEWCSTVALNAGIDYLRSMRDEWDTRAFMDDVDAFRALNWDWQERETEEDAGAVIVLRLLREAHEQEGADAQTLLWHRLVVGDEWAETGGELGIAHTAAKRRFQRMQERLRHAVLKGLIGLGPDELTAARRWILKIDLPHKNLMAISSTLSVPRADV
ncbi:MAG TPA: sigma factor [Longimicrobium sp.]|nr:sigma factor [Longimicrobium sp.]